VVVMVFVKLGLLSYEMMSRTRSYAILAIFVAAAVITPTPDAATLLLMALPMLLLYEICIWLAWLDRRKNRIAEEQEAREREERLIAAGSADDAEYPVSGYPDSHSDPHERGDDGWTVDYDRHEFDDLPEKPPQDDIPPDKP
jgi:hypothetical protein